MGVGDVVPLDGMASRCSWYKAGALFDGCGFHVCRAQLRLSLLGV